MTSSAPPSIFIHRRDLRIDDNRGLAAAASQGAVLGCFILDPDQVGEENPYRSEKQVRFMRECLNDLDAQYRARGGRLHMFAGQPSAIVPALLKSTGARAVFANHDYTPFAIARDETLAAACAAVGASFTRIHDTLLMGDPDLLSNGSGGPFTVFTPFWKRAATIPVPPPAATAGVFMADSVSGVPYADLATLAPTIDPATLATTPGRSGGLAILKRADSFADYATTRDIVALPTTRLSAHHKFGTVSIRETYHAFGQALGYEHALIRQLYWRDFYTYFLARVPRTLEESYDPRHEILYEAPNPERLAAWKAGQTGFPIVDAAMRELAATGYMHNRARMIVGSFLTKDLHQAWWEGEKHFAQHLIDYDPAVNNGNWQWVGSTGADPVPYFRIFNPWLQAKKFDPEAIYIKRWIPELAHVPAASIHAFDRRSLMDDVPYPVPMVDHAEVVRHIRALYAKDAR